MLKLKPTIGIAKRTGVDFDLLSFIISRVYNIREDVIIYVKMTKMNVHAAYFHGQDTVKIYVKENCSLRYIIGCLLHEIRHHFQFQIKEFNTVYRSYREYFNSPEEVDARKCEKLTTAVCKIYNTFKVIEKKKEDLGIDYFMELRYNEAVENNKTKQQLDNATANPN